MQKMIAGLTKRQRYWLEHIQACEASGKSMVEYAASQDITVRAMYGGQKILVKKGVLPMAQATRFQRVQVMEAAVNLVEAPRKKRRLSLQFKRQRKENQKLLSSKLLMVSEVKPSVGGRNQRFNQEAL